ncbi:MAG: efflux RND transporter periplasmic adaptor subunit [Bacteroidales bacterium]|nr:efflux RND transporter periplasmic adaptor subunit [Bacteroidales bacterium]
MNYFKTLTVILTAGIFLASCSSKSVNENAAATGTAAATDTVVIPVRTLELAKSKVARTIDYTATVLPFEEVNLAPSTPGRIEKINVEAGDHVSKGQVLFVMDRTQLYQMKLQLSGLEKDLARLDTLLKSGSARQQQYDQLKTQYDVTKTNVDFMEQNTELKSPFNGIVTGKYFEEGEMYSGAPTTATGKSAVLTLMQVNPLKVVVNVSEQYYPLIKRGMKATVTADVYEDQVFTGTVFRISPTVNALTRSFGVEVELPNRNETLKPGMFARVSMDLGEVESFVAPANSVLMQEGTNIRYVFVAENDRARRVEVSLGKRFDDKLELISDVLKEGDKLIIDGQARLKTNDRLQVKQ